MRVESECLCVWVSNLKKSPIAVKVCIKLIRKWLIEGDSRIKWRTKAFSRTLTRSICVVWKLLGMHDRPWKGTHEKHGRTISQPWYCMLVTVRVSSRAKTFLINRESSTFYLMRYVTVTWLIYSLYSIWWILSATEKFVHKNRIVQ